MDLFPGRTGRTSGIVGTRLIGDRTMRLYLRTGPTVRTDDRPLNPWFLVSAAESAPFASSTARLFPLTGTDPVNTRVSFDGWTELWTAIRSMIEKERSYRGTKVTTYADVPWLYVLPDPGGQWMMVEEERMFAGMRYEEMSVSTIDIETAGGPPDLRKVESADAAVTAVGVGSVHGGTTILRSKKRDERGLLRDFSRLISDADPDVVAGLDLQTAVLPYLERRCALLDVEPRFGRESTPLRAHTSITLRSAFELPGRSVVDVADVINNRELLSVILDKTRPTGNGKELPAFFSYVRKPDKGRALRSRLGTITEGTDILLRGLYPLFQYYSLQPEHIVRSAASFRTETALVRHRLGAAVSIPSLTVTNAPAEHPETGTRVGRFAPAVECLVHPVAPLIVVDRGLGESTDKTPAVEEWTSIQSVSRALLDETHPEAISDRPCALDLVQGFVAKQRQRSVRFRAGIPGDVLASAESRVFASVERACSLHNASVFMHDEGLVFLSLPDNAVTPETFGNFLRGVSSDLPKGMSLAVLCTFDAAVSLGSRLFALLLKESTIFHPSARVPRFFEPFLREFFIASIGYILKMDWANLHALYQLTRGRVANRSIHVREFAKHEALSENVEVYEQELRAGKRHPSAVFEAVKRRDPKARAGTLVRYYITGMRKDVLQAEHSKLSDEWDPAAPDENSEYYLDRLDQVTDRFRELFETGSFERIFSAEDLFGFDPAAIRLAPGHPGFEGLSSRTAARNAPGITLDASDDT